MPLNSFRDTLRDESHVLQRMRDINTIEFSLNNRFIYATIDDSTHWGIFKVDVVRNTIISTVYNSTESADRCMSNIAVGSNGDLFYAVESSLGNFNVIRKTAAGSIVWTSTSRASVLSVSYYSIALDASDNVYITYTDATGSPTVAKIFKYNSSGTYLATWSKTATYGTHILVAALLYSPVDGNIHILTGGLISAFIPGIEIFTVSAELADVSSFQVAYPGYYNVSFAFFFLTDESGNLYYSIGLSVGTTYTPRTEKRTSSGSIISSSSSVADVICSGYTTNSISCIPWAYYPPTLHTFDLSTLIFTSVAAIGSLGQSSRGSSLPSGTMYTQTQFYAYTSGSTKVSLGTPDGGVSVPSLTGLSTNSAILSSQHILDMRVAIQALVASNHFKNPSTGVLYNWTNGNANNLYYVSMGDRTAYGATDGAKYDWTRNATALSGESPADIDIGEVYQCIEKLKTATVV